MTELRDARLRKAMDEAPDAALRPPERTRNVIRAAAHAAVQPAWRRWWPAAGPGRTPWAAAFATVLLAGFITLMWQGQEVPGAREEVAAADQQAPMAPPAPVAVPEAAPAAPVPATAPEAVAKAAPPAATARPQQRQRAARDERAAETKQEQEQRRVEEPAAGPAPAPAAPAAPPPPPPAMADLMRPAPESLAKSQSAPATGAAAPSLRAAAPGVAWNQVRVEADGRSVVFPRAQAGRLAALVARMLQASGDEAPSPGPASMRLELALGDQATGVLEKVGERWRWVPQGQAARMLRVDAALATALQQEAESLLRP